jgi:Kef-type K+ transport system membrane component KefB
MVDMGFSIIGGEKPEMDEQQMLMATLQVALFIIAVYGAGTAMRLIQGPALVAEILVGLLFNAAGWFPHNAENGSDFLPAFKALGYVGLLLMIFDGGVHMDLGMLRKIGARAAILAVSGCLAPVLMVWVVFQYGFGYEFLPAVAAGTALSSTAIGFTVQVLNDNGILQDRLGQLIMAGAMLDDVISLVLLAILGGLAESQKGGGSFSPMTILLPLLASAGVMIVGYGLRAFFVCVDRKAGLTDRLTPEEVVQVERKRVIVYILAMLLGALGIVWLAESIHSSYLLGAFMAGMLATTWPHFQETWDELCEPVLPWLCRCFFACTVGFAVPAAALGSGSAGLIVVTIFIAIISKFITGLLATGCRDPKFMAYTFQVGTAMVGRGELGFVQIQTALEEGILGPRGSLMTTNAYGAIVWSLLIASLVGPVLFRLTLKMKSRDAAPAEESFVMAYNSGEQQPADVEGGLPRLLNNRTANDVGIDAKKEKVSDVSTADATRA